MPRYLRDGPGKLAARYDFVAVLADSWEGEAKYLTVSICNDGDIVELRVRTQHDIVKSKLQQRLQCRPAPFSSNSQGRLNTAHVFLNGWEAKFGWDARYCHQIHSSKLGDLLQINSKMENEGFEGVSNAQGHQGEGTYRDQNWSRSGEPSAGLLFLDTKDDNSHCFINFSANNFVSDFGTPDYIEVRDWDLYGKQRREKDVAEVNWSHGRPTLEFDDTLIIDNGKFVIFFHIDDGSSSYTPQVFTMYGKLPQGDVPALFSDCDILRLKMILRDQEGLSPSDSDEKDEEDEEDVEQSIVQESGPKPGGEIQIEGEARQKNEDQTHQHPQQSQ